MNKFVDFAIQVFRGKSIYRILFNWQVAKYCQNLKGRCLDLACGGEPSYYKYLFLANISELIKTDYNNDKKPDLNIDLNKKLVFKNKSFDNIFLFNAIYIIKKPEDLIREIYRILKKDGRFFMASPFIFNEAKEPDDYRRLTSQGLKRLLKKGGFKKFKIISFGERASAGVHLWHPFFLFNFVRFFAFSKALFLDKLVPKKVRKLHPCSLGYFVIASR